MTDLAKALRELHVCASEALAYGGISGARYAALNWAIGGARAALAAHDTQPKAPAQSKRDLFAAELDGYADRHRVSITLTAGEWRAIAKCVDDEQSARLREALQGLVHVVDAAGLQNLTRGVELGPTVWYMKATDAMNFARAALAQPAHPHDWDADWGHLAAEMRAKDAQPAQEPDLTHCGCGDQFTFADRGVCVNCMIHAQPAQQPLTNERISELWVEAKSEFAVTFDLSTVQIFARAVEAELARSRT